MSFSLCLQTVCAHMECVCVSLVLRYRRPTHAFHVSSWAHTVWRNSENDMVIVNPNCVCVSIVYVLLAWGFLSVSIFFFLWIQSTGFQDAWHVMVVVAEGAALTGSCPVSKFCVQVFARLQLLIRFLGARRHAGVQLVLKWVPFVARTHPQIIICRHRNWQRKKIILNFKSKENNIASWVNEWQFSTRLKRFQLQQELHKRKKGNVYGFIKYQEGNQAFSSSAISSAFSELFCSFPCNRIKTNII